MAHFVYFSGHTDPIPDGHVPDSTEYTLLWAQNYKAINGDDGGTWAPGAFITVGGSGFQFTGTGHSIASAARVSVASGGEIKVLSGGVATIASGGAIDIFGGGTVQSTGSLAWVSGATATFQSGSTCNQNSGSTWNLSGSSLVRGTLTIKAASGPGSLIVEAGTAFDIGTLTAHVVSGGALTWQNGSGLSGATSATATWSGAWTFGGTTTYNATSDIVGNASATAAWAGAWTFSGTTTYTNKLVHSGNNAYRVLRVGAGPDSSTSVQPWHYDILQVPEITGNRIWDLDHPPDDAPFETTLEWPTASGNYSIEFRDGAQTLEVLYDSSDRTLDNIVGSVTVAYDGAEYFVKAVRRPSNRLVGPEGSATIDAWKYAVITATDLSISTAWGFSSPPGNKPCTVIARWTHQTLGSVTLTVLGVPLVFPSTANGSNAICFYDGNAWSVLGVFES